MEKVITESVADNIFNFLPATLMGCNSKSFHSFFQTLNLDCLHIEDVHLLFSAHFMNIISSLRGVELRHFPSKYLDGVWFV